MIRLLILFVIILFMSCRDSNRDKYDNMSYSTVLTALIMENTDLPTISKSTNISQEDLIRIKYGIIAENYELTDYLRQLKYAYDFKDESNVETLLGEHKFIINKKIIGKPLAINIFKRQEYENNQKCQDLLVQTGINCYNKTIKDYIESYFTTWENIKNSLKVSQSSFDDYYLQFEKGLSEILSSENICMILEKRVNAYAQMINKEHFTLYGAYDSISDIKILLPISNASFTMNDYLKDDFITATIDASSSIVRLDLISYIVEKGVGGVFSSQKPYSEIEEEINNQLNDYLNSLDIWVLTDLNNITKNLR